MINVRVAFLAAVAVLGTTAVAGSAAAPEPRAALAGDFDGDGRTDLYRPGAGGAPEVLMFAQPDGSFAVEQVPLAGTFTNLVGDFDGDGRDDILHYSESGPDAVWFGGADRGMSRVPVVAAAGATPVLGDFDGDRVDDVFWSADGRARDKVWYGQATRRFTTRTFAGGLGRATPGDYDGDRHTDLLWIGAGTVWYGGERGEFDVAAAETPSGRTAYVGDFNGDRTSDVFWYAPGTKADYVDYFTVARLSRRVGVEVRGTYRMAVGDFDGDLVSDLLMNGPGADRVWYGTRIGTFTEVRVKTSATARPVAGDFDGNRRADLFWPDANRVWLGAATRELASVPVRQVANRVPALERANYRPYGYVAHAMGPVEGHAYTNSREAFETNYAAGFRMFEVDLVLLADGNVIAAHDRVEHWLGLKKKFRDATLADVVGRKWMGKFGLLTADDLITLLAKHRDVYFILDTKWSHAAIVARMMSKAVDPQVARRMLPHVESQADLDAMRRYYPVQHYVLALYRTQWKGEFDDPAVLAFVRRNDTPAVMMWINTRDPKKSLAANSVERRRYTASFEAALRRAGAVTYVHSTKDASLMEEFEKQGVGVYSDGSYGPPVPPLTPPVPGV